MRFSLIFALLAALVAAPLSAMADQPLRIGYVHAMANAPALIADRKGFFDDEGVDVSVRSLANGPVVQQALAAGELDIAYVGTPPVYQWFSRGLEARILAKVNYGQAAVIVPPDSNAQSVADLRGGKIAGVRKGSGMDVLLRGYVLGEHAGLRPDRDISVVELPPGNMNAALERGLVDAAFSWEPFVTQATTRGSARVLFNVNDALPGYPWYVVIATPKVLRERPDDVVRVLRAHRRAIAFLDQHQAESNRLIAEAFQLEPVTNARGERVPPEDIVAGARRHLGWSAELNDDDLAFIRKLMGYSKALGFVTRPPALDDLVDPSFLKRAAEAP